MGQRHTCALLDDFSRFCVGHRLEEGLSAEVTIEVMHVRCPRGAEFRQHDGKGSWALIPFLSCGSSCGYNRDVVLPGADRLVVQPEKVRDYLLSATHPVGRFKAVFFSRLGFESTGWADLRDALIDMARTGQVSAGHPSPYGKKFEVRGTLRGPKGAAETVSVWIVLTGEDVPRFVTAFPE